MTESRPSRRSTSSGGTSIGRWSPSLTLSVFPQNAAAIALYEKFGFVEEGRRVKHMRRANGELWDLLEMGLLL